MFLTKFYGNVVGTTLRCLNRHINYKNTKAFLSNHSYSKIRHLRIMSSPNFMQCRNFLNESQSQVELPPLSNEPLIVEPNALKFIYNIFKSYVSIPEQFDRDFNLTEFLQGSKQAVCVVSNALANENYESISHLVTPDVIQSLKNKINTFSSKQKQLLAFNKDDICASFPYDISLKFDADTADRKYLEIVAVHHIFHGFSSISADYQITPFNLIPIQKYKEKVFVCNYRYVREFTKGVESSWTINMVNYFRLSSAM